MNPSQQPAANSTTAPFIDGGPAFSRPISSLNLNDGTQEIYGSQEGMTLRDYFAAKAMAAVMAWNGDKLETARIAYEMADAMLAARKATGKDGGQP